MRSRAAGITYYQQGNPSAALVVGQQKAETIDAINFGIGLGGNFKVIDEMDTDIYSSYALAEEKDNRSFLQD